MSSARGHHLVWVLMLASATICPGCWWTGNQPYPPSRVIAWATIDRVDSDVENAIILKPSLKDTEEFELSIGPVGAWIHQHFHPSFPDRTVDPVHIHVHTLHLYPWARREVARRLKLSVSDSNGRQYQLGPAREKHAPGRRADVWLEYRILGWEHIEFNNEQYRLTVHARLEVEGRVFEGSGIYRCSRPVDSSGGPEYVPATAHLAKTCRAVIPRLKLARAVPNHAPCESLEAARNLIWRNVSMAAPPSRCTEYEGWYLFSGGDRGTVDDGTFRSGLAVKKGTAEVYQWEQRME